MKKIGEIKTDKPIAERIKGFLGAIFVKSAKRKPDAEIPPIIKPKKEEK